MGVAALQHPAVEAALATAGRLLGMEMVFVGSVDDSTFTFERVRGGWNGIAEGMTLPRADAFCDRLLAGAPPTTADAAADPAYADVPARTTLGVTSYVGVPVRDEAGRLLGTLCGIDRRSVPVPPGALDVLSDLAGVIASHWGRAAEPVIRRVPSGWLVDGQVEGDLASAMVLADLLSGDLPPQVRPARPEEPLDEVERLKLSVLQLEHALAARVTIEQAIGVLAERHRLAPRAAFERLRRAARSRGRKVHDLARIVVASSTDPSAPLPPELAGRPRPPVG